MFGMWHHLVNKSLTQHTGCHITTLSVILYFLAAFFTHVIYTGSLALHYC